MTTKRFSLLVRIECDFSECLDGTPTIAEVRDVLQKEIFAFGGCKHPDSWEAYMNRMATTKVTVAPKHPRPKGVPKITLPLRDPE